MKKTISILLVAILSLALFAACGSTPAETPATTDEAPVASTTEEAAEPAGDAPTAENPKTFLVSHTFYVGNPLDLALVQVTENITERTGGALLFELYDASQIAVGVDGVEQCIRGADFINVYDFSCVADWVPEMNGLAAPFLVSSQEEFSELVQGEFVAGLTEKAAEAGVRMLAYDYGFGMRHVGTTGEPITSLADMQGFKLRVPATSVWVDTFTLLGANPTPIPWEDVYNALETGLVDGYDMPNGDDYDMGMSEFLTSKTETGHFIGLSSVMMSEEVWQSLTEEQRTIMQEEFAAGAIYNNELIAEFDSTGREGLIAEGVEIIELDDLTEWREAVQPFYEALPGWDDGAYDLMLEELEAIRAG